MALEQFGTRAGPGDANRPPVRPRRRFGPPGPRPRGMAILGVEPGAGPARRPLGPSAPTPDHRAAAPGGRPPRPITAARRADRLARRQVPTQPGRRPTTRAAPERGGHATGTLPGARASLGGPAWGLRRRGGRLGGDPGRA